MPVVVAEGVVELTADANDVPRQVAKDIDAGGSKVHAAGLGLGKQIFGGVLAGWAAIGGINAVVGFFTGAVTGARDLNETMSASTQIFGTQAKQIDAWGDTADTALGLSKQAAIEAALGFGNMFTQLGWTSQAAADLSTKTVQVAADLGSFRNLPTADVADRISAALRGEYDSLQLLIPNINAARVESEALAATGKTVASELTAQEKAAATLAIVERDGAAAMGDFARTAEGAANKQKSVTAELTNQQGVLGQQLLPVWTGFLGFLSGTAVPVITNVVTWLGENADTVLTLAAVLGGAILTYGILTTAIGLHTAFVAASAAAEGGLTVAQWALNAAMAANPIGLIVTAIALLVGAIVWIATQTTWFQDIWAGMVEFIGAAWTYLWENYLEPVFTAIGEVFTWLYANVILPIVILISIQIAIWGAIFTWLWETVLSPIFTAIGEVFGWLYDNIILPIIGLIAVQIQMLGAVFTWLYDNIIRPVFNGVAAAFGWLWTNVIKPVNDFITSAILTVGKTVSDVFGGIASFIGAAFQSVLGVVKAPINALIDLVNGIIKGLNSIRVTLPDWIPGVGGQTFGLRIPTVPRLATGTNNAPDAFIAGEDGPELITGARGSTVRPYSATQDLLTRASGGGGVTIHGNVILDASNVKDFTDVVTMIQALPQVARTGRGNGGAH